MAGLLPFPELRSGLTAFFRLELEHGRRPVGPAELRGGRLEEDRTAPVRGARLVEAADAGAVPGDGGAALPHDDALADAGRGGQATGTGQAFSWRLMTSRWIWLVPSKICMILASRMYRSTGKSRV
ncbi:hypothetical protein GCM10019017_70470 [Streptomyces showdoensis]